MIVLYYTNKDINDWDVIPNILKNHGDTVITRTDKFDLDFIINNNIDFIVSDRSRFLISADVIEYLDRKIINFHPSFLPWNRGYHPNYWSIKENTPHGITIHFIDENIDSGDIIAQTRCYYSDEDTLRDTYDRLRRLMVNLFETCWIDIRSGKLKGFYQDSSKSTIHYKSDFIGHYDSLEDGWDTKIKYVK